MTLVGVWTACGGRVPALTIKSPKDVFTSPEQIARNLETARGMDRDALLAHYHTPFSPIAYTPSAGQHLDLIQKSRLRLDAEEKRLLERHGFVISRRQAFPSFALAYLDIYREDLPVYVTADAIAHAWHRAYDELLRQLETRALLPSLERLLGGLVGRLGTLPSGTTRSDLAEYLAVADGLLHGSFESPRYGSANRVRGLFEDCSMAHGVQRVELFGKPRWFHFSMCKPRGHYTKTEELKRYFRAMTWLGRADFRVIETAKDASQSFQRRQLEDVVALRSLLNPELLELWQSLTVAVTVFVGMHDGGTLADVDRYLAKLGAIHFDLRRFSDHQLRERLEQGGYGRQRIMGHVMEKNSGAPELPLNTSFVLFGQRYAIDSHVFHAVTEDRVPGRQLPNPLDVGFAVFANNAAGPLLGPELGRYSGQLSAMRTLVAAQRDAYWKSSLYSVWLWALRGLSPDGDDHFMDRPRLMRSEPWARRLLNTSLGSWSELRHDSILYVKESFSVFVTCEFPDVYVDPYPAFYARLRQSAAIGRGAIAQLKSDAVDEKGKTTLEHADDYFVRFDEIVSRLQDMAEREVAGEALSGSDCGFVNDMVRSHRGKPVGCGGGPMLYDGWYVDLLYDDDVADPDYTVADVHVSKEGFLEVAKGLPRRMVLTLDTPQGLRAFVGAVYSFHSFVNDEPMDDGEWSREAMTAHDVPWFTDLVAHAAR